MTKHHKKHHAKRKQKQKLKRIDWSAYGQAWAQGIGWSISNPSLINTGQAFVTASIKLPGGVWRFMVTNDQGVTILEIDDRVLYRILPDGSRSTDLLDLQDVFRVENGSLIIGKNENNG